MSLSYQRAVANATILSNSSRLDDNFAGAMDRLKIHVTVLQLSGAAVVP